MLNCKYDSRSSTYQSLIGGSPLDLKLVLNKAFVKHFIQNCEKRAKAKVDNTSNIHLIL